MTVLLQTAPQDDPVYRFMDKKRCEGKPYFVYMTAGANKFLRVYYGRVKEYLAQQGHEPPQTKMPGIFQEAGATAGSPKDTSSEKQ